MISKLNQTYTPQGLFTGISEEDKLGITKWKEPEEVDYAQLEYDESIPVDEFLAGEDGRIRYFDREETRQLLNRLKAAKVSDIRISDNTVFFEPTENIDFEKLMYIIAEFSPQEFSKEKGRYRMWFD